MRKFYGIFQICETVSRKFKKPVLSTKLSWSHYFEVLEAFLLELGKGFAFVKRQYRIPVSNRNFSVDLVFYNILLKCYVLIDLKRGEVEHSDIGQMNFYLNYFRKEINTETDNEPIGIVLGAYKDKIICKQISALFA